ncbi:MAG TPA: STAS domain-containing protein [Blastocatellia bacterium]|nr:STAS domain-containing protein [Blastocatellia bacterium]
MNMTIQERKLDDITVLDLEGTFVLGGDSDFKKRVETAITDGSRRLLINLAKVSYMDSSGLGELISGYTKMQRVSGHMKLFNLSKRLNQLLVITKLITVFETFDSESAAISSFTADAKLLEVTSADGTGYSHS